MARSKWLRWTNRRTENVDNLGGSRTHYREIGPVSYMALSFVGEFYPAGVFRSVWAGRVGLLWGPGDGTVENVPDGARFRVWWTRGETAIVLVLAGEGNGDA